MAQGWHGDSAGHARAGRIGGLKSAQTRRARAQEFGERLPLKNKQKPASGKKPPAKAQYPAM